ncbi:hypothetical protein AVEN_84880-1, partial [Araneus ventricosus]
MIENLIVPACPEGSKAQHGPVRITDNSPQHGKATSPPATNGNESTIRPNA